MTQIACQLASLLGCVQSQARLGCDQLRSRVRSPGAPSDDLCCLRRGSQQVLRRQSPQRNAESDRDQDDLIVVKNAHDVSESAGEGASDSSRLGAPARLARDDRSRSSRSCGSRSRQSHARSRASIVSRGAPGVQQAQRAGGWACTNPRTTSSIQRSPLTRSRRSNRGANTARASSRMSQRSSTVGPGGLAEGRSRGPRASRTMLGSQSCPSPSDRPAGLGHRTPHRPAAPAGRPRSLGEQQGRDPKI